MEVDETDLAHDGRDVAVVVLRSRPSAGVPLEHFADVLEATSTRVTSSLSGHRTTPTVEAAVARSYQLLGVRSRGCARPPPVLRPERDSNLGHEVEMAPASHHDLRVAVTSSSRLSSKPAASCHRSGTSSRHAVSPTSWWCSVASRVTFSPNPSVTTDTG